MTANNTVKEVLNCSVGRQKVALLPDNSIYRVGDLWYNKGTPANRARNLEHYNAIRNESRYIGTIMQCYFLQRDWWQHDASIFRKCCATLQEASFGAAGSEVVLHLRVGDKDPPYMFDKMVDYIAQFIVDHIHAVAKRKGATSLANDIYGKTTR